MHIGANGHGMNGVEDRIVTLIADLEAPEKTRIRAAVDALIQVAADAPAVRAALEQCVGDEGRKNRWAVAYVLGHLPRPSSATIRALLKGLDRSEPDIRWAIALLLIQMVKGDGDLANLLLTLSAKGTVNQRRMAIYCIRDLRLTDHSSMAALLTAATDEEPTVRVAALTSLRWRSDSGSAARRRLLERYLDDPDGRVRNAAAVTLAQLGDPDETFTRALEQGAKSADAHARKAAVAALELLQKKRPAPNGS